MNRLSTSLITPGLSGVPSSASRRKAKNIASIPRVTYKPKTNTRTRAKRTTSKYGKSVQPNDSKTLFDSLYYFDVPEIPFGRIPLYIDDIYDSSDTRDNETNVMSNRFVPMNLLSIPVVDIQDPLFFDVSWDSMEGRHLTK